MKKKSMNVITYSAIGTVNHETCHTDLIRSANLPWCCNEQWLLQQLLNKSFYPTIIEMGNWRRRGKYDSSDDELIWDSDS